jgi:hypothetical protein
VCQCWQPMMVHQQLVAVLWVALVSQWQALWVCLWMTTIVTERQSLANDRALVWLLEGNHALSWSIIPLSSLAQHTIFAAEMQMVTILCDP